MVRILGICGSPRRKSAYVALRTALEGAAASGEEAETSLVELRGRDMHLCIHCNKCLREKADRCVIFEDDMTPLYDEFYNADGIIIASPVYEMNITAQTASFMHRFRSAWIKGVREPEFFIRKVGAGITVGGTRNGGQESAMNAINNFFLAQGMTLCSGGNGMYTGAMLWNPGDGSTDMDDPVGLENARILGRNVAVMARIMKEARLWKS
ncbi:MAG: flavodoxin family protein [Spirochaetia bacterium]|jgi:multimeric flavodoxin WrbA|nr:flavodoxin family protein [Spirochaetia bacterium]